MAPSCMNMVGPVTGGCQCVAQPECRGPRQGSSYRAYLARIPRTVLPGISEIRPMAAAFIPATEVPTTHHR